MPFHYHHSIRYYTFDSLEEAGITHAVFTRLGGLSPEPWKSLNVGGLRGDDPDRVKANRVLSFQSLGKIPESVYDAWQVHGVDVACAEAPRPADVPHKKADTILTDRPEVSLFMRFADCVPILIYDPVRNVAGIAHAGWQGTVRGAARVAIETMQARYGTHPKDILAAIGPSIAAHHYEVGPEVIERVRSAFGSDAPTLLPKFNGAVHFDLWAANCLQLEQAGVRKIEVSGICTACNTGDWFSHRAEKGQTGRFGALIAVKPS